MPFLTSLLPEQWVRKANPKPPEPELDPEVALRAWLHDIAGLKHNTPLPDDQLNRLKAALRVHLPHIKDVAAHLWHIGVEVIVTHSPDLLSELCQDDACKGHFVRLIRALSRRRETHVLDAIQPHLAALAYPFR